MSWTRKLLPRSLRARLILSFGLLIFIALFFAGTTTVYLLKEQQEDNAQERVGLLARPVAYRAAVLEALGYPPNQIQAELQEEYAVRILLVDSQGQVVADSGSTLRGHTLTNEQMGRRSPAPADDAGGPQPKHEARYETQRLEEGKENLLLFAAPEGVLAGPNGQVLFRPELRAIIAVPASDIKQAWRDLLPRFFLSGGIAFFVSVILAGLLARSMIRPLRQITTASEEMARGRYDQQIPAYGGEEVGRMAQAFNEMARQVSRSHRTLRDFLANVSHELKTPLTSIQGFSQAMVDGSLEQRQDYAEAGRIINDEAVRMRGLVDDLLYLSQVDQGQLVMQFDSIDANELLTATRERFERRAAQANVALTVEGVDLPPVQADARRLEQALANIVDNAIRHTPAGGRISMRSRVSDGQVQLSLHNNGSVIPLEVLPRIFERFVQADPVGQRKDGNTGLGLAITREIVEAHGGSVSVTSSREAGTEFLIKLPAAPAHANGAAPAKQELPAAKNLARQSEA